MAHYYGMSQREIGRTSYMAIIGMLEEIPEIAFRQELPLARFMALFGNALGGKGKGGKVYNPLEDFIYSDFLSPWAMPDGVDEPHTPRMNMTRETAQLILRLGREHKLAGYIHSLNALDAARKTLGNQARKV